VTTIGAVQREIPADRLALTLEITATEKTLDESVVKLESLLEEFYAQMAKLKYPTTAVTVKERRAMKAWEWIDQKRVPHGFSSSGMLSLNLLSLTNYGSLLNYMGTQEEYQILSTRLASSEEGAVRRNAMGEALQAARTKATLLAEEGKARLGKLLEVSEEEVEAPEPNRYRNARDPNEGTATYPIEILVRVRAKFELTD
jgi:uncharacterized protein YggE